MSVPSATILEVVPEAAPAATAATGTRKALGNSAFLAAYYSVDAALLFSINLLLARSLGVVEYGRLAFALSYGVLISSLDPGFNMAVTKFVARDPQRGNPWIEAGMSLRITLTISLLLLSLLPLSLPGYMRENAFFIAVVGGSEILRSVTLGCNSVFRGLQCMGWEGVVLATERVTLLCGCAVLLSAGHGATAIGWMFLGSRALSLLTGWIILRWKAGSMRFRPWPAMAGTLLRESYPLALLSLSDRINLYLPAVLLTLVIGEAATGLFQAANKIVMFPLIICGVMGMGVFPAMSASFGDPEQVKRLYRYGVRLLWHCLVPCGIMTFFFARPMVTVLFGKQYEAAASILQLLTPYYLVQVIITMGYFVHTAINRQTTAMRLGLMSVVLNAVMASVMMKFYGPNGVALALTATNSIVAACYWRLGAKRGLRFASAPRDRWQWAGFALMVGLFAWLSPRIPIHGWTQLLLAGFGSVAIYVILLTLTRGFLPEEVRLLLNLKTRMLGRA
jgi:O-antigen/teichoic acid export membrane protein